MLRNWRESSLREAEAAKVEAQRAKERAAVMMAEAEFNAKLAENSAKNAKTVPIKVCR